MVPQQPTIRGLSRNSGVDPAKGSHSDARQSPTGAQKVSEGFHATSAVGPVVGQGVKREILATRISRNEMELDSRSDIRPYSIYEYEIEVAAINCC